MNGALAFVLGSGFKSIKPALYGWFFNLLFSLTIYFGIYKLFFDASGTSILASNVIGQIGIYTFLNDIFMNYSGALPLVVLISVVSACLFFASSVFVAGGIFSVVVENKETSITSLVSSSAENFFNMLKIFLFNILILSALLLIPAFILLLFLAFGPEILNEKLSVVLTYLWIGLVVLLFIFSTIVHDYARIFKLKEDRNLFHTFKRAIRFVLSNKFNILVIFVIYTLSLSILYLILMVTSSLRSNFFPTVLLFILCQVFIISRYYLKVVVIRAEVYLLGSKEE